VEVSARKGATPISGSGGFDEWTSPQDSVVSSPTVAGTLIDARAFRVITSRARIGSARSAVMSSDSPRSRRAREEREPVGVGIAVTHDPLHGSGRAGLPHPALALGEDGKSLAWMGMTDEGLWQPMLHGFCEARPWHSASLAAVPKRPQPDSRDCESECRQRWAVHGHAVVAVVPSDDRTQVGTYLWNGNLQASFQLGSHRLKLCLPPSAHRLASYRERPLSGLSADMREGVSAPRSVRGSRHGVPFSRLDGQPACTPADASPSFLRTTTHGSGPV
jgi:hypothetical protein